MKLKLDNVLGIFNKALVKLEQFTEQCDQDISICQSQIDSAEHQKRVVEQEKDKAINSLNKIKEIVG